MVGAILATVGLWLSFIIISAAFLVLAVIGGYYGLKLIDYIENWYKGQSNEK